MKIRKYLLKKYNYEWYINYIISKLQNTACVMCYIPLTDHILSWNMQKTPDTCRSDKAIIKNVSAIRIAWECSIPVCCWWGGGVVWHHHPPTGGRLCLRSLETRQGWHLSIHAQLYYQGKIILFRSVDKCMSMGVIEKNKKMLSSKETMKNYLFVR